MLPGHSQPVRGLISRLRYAGGSQRTLAAVVDKTKQRLYVGLELLDVFPVAHLRRVNWSVSRHHNATPTVKPFFHSWLGCGCHSLHVISFPIVRL